MEFNQNISDILNQIFNVLKDMDRRINSLEEKTYDFNNSQYFEIENIRDAINDLKSAVERE